MSILVTGGAGFVGAYVVRALLQHGEHVVAYDSVPANNALDLVLPETADRRNLVLEKGQITDGWRLARLCDAHNVTALIHLASPLTTDVNAEPHSGVIDICGGTATVFEVSRACSLERVVWASSIAVFGPAGLYEPGPLPDDAPHYPASLYGSCKSLCEKMAQTYFERDGTHSIGLRLTVVYGPGRLRGYMTFPTEVIRHAALGEAVEMPFGDQVINWQYVEDVASMFVAALTNAPLCGGVTVNTFGEAHAFRDVVPALKRLLLDPPITVRPGKFDDDPDRTDAPVIYDDAFLREHAGFEPRFPFEVGIEATFRRYQELNERERTVVASASRSVGLDKLESRDLTN